MKVEYKLEDESLDGLVAQISEKRWQPIGDYDPYDDVETTLMHNDSKWFCTMQVYYHERVAQPVAVKKSWWKRIFS